MGRLIARMERTRATAPPAATAVSADSTSCRAHVGMWHGVARWFHLWRRLCVTQVSGGAPLSAANIDATRHPMEEPALVPWGTSSAATIAAHA